MRTTRLRVTLLDVEPTVRRVLDVPAKSTLPELHLVLQAGMGWTDSHVHRFITGDLRYGVPDPDFDDDDDRDEAGATVRDLGTRFIYRYDLGDDWQHDVLVLGPGGERPGCVFAEGACPPEDCGGAPGYAHLLAVLADERHPEYQRMRAWAGDLPDVEQAATDDLVRRVVGEVPECVRLLLDLLAGGVKLTPGGRLPRSILRAVHERRPHWYPWDKAPAFEEDIFPLATLHDLLRRVGLLRLSHGVLTPTKAASDQLEIVRRLRRALPPHGFHATLADNAVAVLAVRGPMATEALAAAVHPALAMWSTRGHLVTVADVQTELGYLDDILQSLDLVEREWATWRPGPSARSLLPRATALAELWSRLEGRPPG